MISYRGFVLGNLTHFNKGFMYFKLTQGLRLISKQRVSAW